MPEAIRQTTGMSVDAVAKDGFAITPSDSTQISFKSIWVGTAGNIAILHTIGGTPVTYTNVPAGKFFEVQGVKVMSTNTTASGLIGVIW